jgi:hypothetical protein
MLTTAVRCGLVLSLLTAVPLRAQEPGPESPQVQQALAVLGMAANTPVPAAIESAGNFLDPAVTPAGCASCSQPLPAPNMGGTGADCPGCSAGCGCYPGQAACAVCEGNSLPTRIFCAIYHGICCPDPCYEPRWLGVANASFFTDGARPVTQTRLRWDYGRNLIRPDRSEYFWARADGRGKGPRPRNGALAETKLDYHEVHLYTEVAEGRASLGTDLLYRSINPEVVASNANFGDVAITAKSLLVDCELFQAAYQLTTTTPVGNPLKGIGVGHLSLEPSVMIAIKLAPETFLQAQVAEWIPLGGDDDYMGAILRYSASLNHVLAKPVRDAHLIGTLEIMGYTFQDGQYTDPVLGSNQKSGGESFVYLGGGLRFVFCDKFDLGFGAMTAFGTDHFAQHVFRTEFRYRY